MSPAGQTEGGQIPVWRRPIFRLAGSAVVLALLIVAIPFNELVDALRRMPIWVLPLALVAYLSLHLIGIVKWRLVTNTAGAGLSFRNAARAYYAGLFGNTFLPSIVGGDVVRAGVALSVTRSKSGLLLGSLVDRVGDIISLGAVAGIGALLLPRALDPRSRAVFLSLGAVLLVAAIVGVVVLTRFPVRRLPYKVRRKLVHARRALRATAQRPQAIVAAIGLGMLLQALLVVLNYALGLTIGIAIPLYVWLFVWPLAKISGLAPVTQGGIGVREAAQVVLFAPFGVAAAMALAVGLVFEAIIIIGGLIGGAIAYLLGVRGWGLGVSPASPKRRAGLTPNP
ncbi:MAG TPA: lysylphosphatidylglycerol synthase transmembrane domain-containing protein [Gemmatimonadaceae bacterium]|nr:lysylphosphatidylglycerol synthase transmembrane domain-containing protein [Gemmatimonadaceae bacterium]